MFILRETENWSTVSHVCLSRRRNKGNVNVFFIRTYAHNQELERTVGFQAQPGQSVQSDCTAHVLNTEHPAERNVVVPEPVLPISCSRTYSAATQTWQCG